MTSARALDPAGAADAAGTAPDPAVADGAAGSVAELLERIDALGPVLVADAARHDRDGTVASANLERLWAAGIAKLSLPAADGGFEPTLREAFEVIARLGRYDPASALLVTMDLRRKQEYLDPLRSPLAPALRQRMLDAHLAGPSLINVLGSEPALGSGPRGIPATTAVRAGDDPAAPWLLTGHKTYCTGSTALAWMVVLAQPQPRTTPDGAVVRPAWLLVDASAPGITIVDTWDHLGMRATVSHDVHFDHVEVPADQILVRQVGTSDTFDSVHTSVQINALYLGAAERGLDWLVEHLNGRVPSGLGAPLSTLLTFQEAVGDVAAKLRIARRLLGDLADGVDRGGAAAVAAGDDVSIVKLEVTRLLVDAVSRAVELVGNAGLTSAQPIQKVFRDVLCSRVHSPHADLVLQTLGRQSLGVAAPGGS